MQHDRVCRLPGGHHAVRVQLCRRRGAPSPWQALRPRWRLQRWAGLRSRGRAVRGGHRQRDAKLHPDPRQSVRRGRHQANRRPGQPRGRGTARHQPGHGRTACAQRRRCGGAAVCPRGCGPWRQPHPERGAIHRRRLRALPGPARPAWCAHRRAPTGVFRAARPGSDRSRDRARHRHLAYGGRHHRRSGRCADGARGCPASIKRVRARVQSRLDRLSGRPGRPGAGQNPGRRHRLQRSASRTVPQIRPAFGRKRQSKRQPGRPHIPCRPPAGHHPDARAGNRRRMRRAARPPN